jgi:4-hydroxy-2-oxoheptanedioate aldolase
MRRNRLRELLRAGEPSLATHVMSTWPTIVELVGQTGHWDYVEFVAEYAPWTLHDLDNIGRAVELFPDFSAMVKIDQHMRGHLAMRAIGSGIQNVLFADVRTADDARACVRAVRPEHPDFGGRLGVGMRRDSRTLAHVGDQDWIEALRDTVVAVMIEKKQAVEDLESILAVDGIDMVQFGPADYAVSLGVERAHPGVAEAEQHLIESAQRRGVAVRAEPPSAAAAKRYLDMGVRHFCVNHDLGILHEWFTTEGARLRELLAGDAEVSHARNTEFLY